MDTDVLEGYKTLDEFAAFVERDKRTLHRWHARRIGPPRVKCGSKILYPVDGIKKWLESRTVHPIKGAG